MERFCVREPSMGAPPEICIFIRIFTEKKPSEISRFSSYDPNLKTGCVQIFLKNTILQKFLVPQKFLHIYGPKFYSYNMSRGALFWCFSPQYALIQGLRNFLVRRNFYGNRFFGKIWNRIVKFILTHSELVSISGTKSFQ